MASYTNRFHHCRSAALNLIHELLTLDTRLQEDERRALKNNNEKLHAAAVVAQYHLDYALERARAATVVPTNASGPAKPREHMENQDAYERFLENGQTLAHRNKLSEAQCLDLLLAQAELALRHARETLELMHRVYADEGLTLEN